MKAFTPTSASLAQFRAWLVTAIASVLAISQAAALPIYSTAGGATTNGGCANAIACAVLGGGVINASRATDSDLRNYATMYKVLGVGSAVSLRMPLSATGQAGDRAGVLVALDRSIASASLLGDYTLNTYLNGALQETKPVSASLVQSLQLLSGQDRPVPLEFVAGLPFDAVELVASGTVGLLYQLNVYNSYSVPSLVKPQVKGALSKFATTGAGLQPYYGAGTANVGAVSVCVGNTVQDPDRAVDNDLTNYARFNNTVGVGCAQALAVRLAVTQPVPAGYYAGFVVGSSGLLDLSVLSGLRISTYLNGVATGETVTGANLLELRALPNNQYQVSFPTTLPFTEVKIERVGLVSALDNLRLYYGFGVEPTAFQATNHVRSDYAAPAASSYQVTGSSLACVTFSTSCTVINAANAADNDLTNYASINSAVALLATNELKLGLNGATTAGNGGNVGLAGNRAGMVVGTGAGLLDVTALDRITISTYDNNNNLIESASGRSALGLSVLSSNTQEISFLTTQPFAKVQISVSSGAALGSNIAVYYAFADDRTGGLPAIIVPLPVELSSFTGQWNSGAAELNWATASEKNSSYFVVERSTGGDMAFRAVGQVTAAGNSSSPKAYRLRDAEAGTQGAATLYYRLRQVDQDGKEAFSPVVALAVGKLAVVAPQLEVYPNPAPDTKWVMVRCPNLPIAGGTVQTYSQLGQLVSQVAVTEAAGSLALPTLAPGLYHVVLRDAAGRQLAAQRLVVGSH